MTTPQNPGDGATPQDPSDPQNPYGTPPPPPPSSPAGTPPPAPPTTPIPSAPPFAPAAPDSGPVPPPYGDPSGSSATPPPTPPTTPGQPAYGQPAYGQPAYGQPSFPQYGAPGPAQPGKGMAITALVASILGCTCIGILVAVPLAIVVLVRSRGGQNHGKGLAIAALVISLISAIGLAVGGYYIYDYAKDFKTIDGLSQGDCITADGLTDSSASGVSSIRSVGCSTKHDGEVLAVHDLTADEASSFSTMTPLQICTPPVTEAGSVDLLSNPDLLIIALTQDSDPKSGDQLACVIANADGSQLTSRLGS